MAATSPVPDPEKMRTRAQITAPDAATRALPAHPTAALMRPAQQAAQPLSRPALTESNTATEILKPAAARTLARQRITPMKHTAEVARDAAAHKPQLHPHLTPALTQTATKAHSKTHTKLQP